MQTVEGTVFVTLADRKCYGKKHRIDTFGDALTYVTDDVNIIAIYNV